MIWGSEGGWSGGMPTLAAWAQGRCQDPWHKQKCSEPFSIHSIQKMRIGHLMAQYDRQGGHNGRAEHGRTKTREDMTGQQWSAQRQ